MIGKGNVREVLLVDEWHKVTEGTFRLVSFDYGGAKESVLGFEFEESGSMGSDIGNVLIVSGPLTSILAVKRERASDPLSQDLLSRKQ